jgi:hypothetical protein
MPDVTLRPLSFGELLDQGVTLFRRLFVSLLLVQLICTGIIVPIQVFLVARGEQLSPVYFLVMLLNFVLSALASAAVALLISENYLGRPLRPLEALKQALPKVWPVITLSLALGLVMLLAAIPALIAFAAGSIFLVPTGGAIGLNIPLAIGLFLAGLALMLLPFAVFAGLALATPALVIEGLGAGEALRRSWTLTKGFRMRVIGLLLVTMLLIMIPIVAIGMAGGFVAPHSESPTAISALLTFLSAAVMFTVTPLIYCVLTLLYYDFRVRKEAFDLQMLADALAA